MIRANFDKNKKFARAPVGDLGIRCFAADAHHTTMIKPDNMSTLYAQKITKVPVKNIDNSNKRIPIKKHFPASTREWINSVYTYNSKKTICFPAIDKMVTKLIKIYFNAYPIADRMNK